MERPHTGRRLVTNVKINTFQVKPFKSKTLQVKTFQVKTFGCAARDAGGITRNLLRKVPS
jgi:hypothetical protein